MENFDLASLDRFRAPKIQDYIAVIGKTTRVMNLRIVKKNNDNVKYQYSSIFECGADILPLANGDISSLPLLASTLSPLWNLWNDIWSMLVGRGRKIALIADISITILSTDWASSLQMIQMLFQHQAKMKMAISYMKK